MALWWAIEIISRTTITASRITSIHRGVATIVISIPIVIVRVVVTRRAVIWGAFIALWGAIIIPRATTASRVTSIPVVIRIASIQTGVAIDLF
jgi:hypothetical protein